MHNSYRKMMQQQCLSEQAKQAFYYNLPRTEKKSYRPFFLKAAIAVVCVLVLLPLTGRAVKMAFGVSLVEIFTGAGQDKTGYEVTYPVFENRPLSDFPEKIQKTDGYRLTVYTTWQDAEEELGITFVNNPFLHGEMFTKEYAYNLKEEGIFSPAHCYASYNGQDNQLYRAVITAAYGHKNMHITVRTTVTCDHPAISQEENGRLHGSSVMYKAEDVESVTQEQYTAANGVTATVVTVDQIGGKPTRYEAGFSANGASYRITVNGSRTGQDGEARETLIQILEGFVF